MAIFIVDLEAVETRYTGQWKEHIPAVFKNYNQEVTVIDGPTDIPSATTPGAFLNFGGTNIYKSEQVSKIGRLFCEGKIVPGDQFLFTDAWHPGIINLKYMSELLNIPVKIHAMWHAGSYDPHDFLGRLIGDKPWVRHTEKALFDAIDHNYFATDFHIDLFLFNLLDLGRMADKEIVDGYFNAGKIVRTGWPFETLHGTIRADMYGQKKHDLILFPHRIAPEKQPEIFKDLAASMPEYEWVMCQEQTLTKKQYHELLGQAKLVVSFNLQETLGISGYEALSAGANIILPDRLSYTEMYEPFWKYPSEWTVDLSSYKANKHNVQALVKSMMVQHGELGRKREQQRESLERNFFSAVILYKNIMKNERITIDLNTMV